MGNGRQSHKFSSPKNRDGILCIVLVLMEIHADAMEIKKQLIDLEWPYQPIIPTLPTLPILPILPTLPYNTYVTNISNITNIINITL